jgi:hypothetical protein
MSGTRTGPSTPTGSETTGNDTPPTLTGSATGDTEKASRGAKWYFKFTVLRLFPLVAFAMLATGALVPDYASVDDMLIGGLKYCKHTTPE